MASFQSGSGRQESASTERTPSKIVRLTLLATPFCWRVRDGGLMANPLGGKVLLKSIAGVLPSIVWPEMDDLLAQYLLIERDKVLDSLSSIRLGSKGRSPKLPGLVSTKLMVY